MGKEDGVIRNTELGRRQRRMHEWQTISMAGRGPSYDCTHMSVNIKVCAHTQAHGIRRNDVPIIIHSYYFFQCC